MEDLPPPPAEYTERVYRQVASYLTDRGLTPDKAVAGCARCQACSVLGAMQKKPLLQIGPPPGRAR
jgi:hypothetical protein